MAIQGNEEGRRCCVVNYRSLDPLIGFPRVSAGELKRARGSRP